MLGFDAASTRLGAIAINNAKTIAAGNDLVFFISTSRSTYWHPTDKSHDER
jgi:hypothetical protein